RIRRNHLQSRSSHRSTPRAAANIESSAAHSTEAGLSRHEVQSAIRLYKQHKRLKISGRNALCKQVDQDYVAMRRSSPEPPSVRRSAAVNSASGSSRVKVRLPTRPWLTCATPTRRLHASGHRDISTISGCSPSTRRGGSTYPSFS